MCDTQGALCGTSVMWKEHPREGRTEKRLSSLIPWTEAGGSSSPVRSYKRSPVGEVLQQVARPGKREGGLCHLNTDRERESLEKEDADVLVVGGPTRRHETSPAMRAFLAGLPRRILRGVGAAAFDTRYHMSAWKSGSAASRIASRLKRAGASLLLPPESFLSPGGKALSRRESLSALSSEQRARANQGP